MSLDEVNILKSVPLHYLDEVEEDESCKTVGCNGATRNSGKRVGELELSNYFQKQIN